MNFNCNPKNRKELNKRWQKDFTSAQRAEVQAIYEAQTAQSGVFEWGNKCFEYHTKNGTKLVTRIYPRSKV